MLFYQTEDGQSRIQVLLTDSTVWLNLRLLAELYQVSARTIIYSDHELSLEATIRKFRLVQTDGSRHIERLALSLFKPSMISLLVPALMIIMRIIIAEDEIRYLPGP